MKAIITGASRGLGKDIACFLAQKGFSLVLISSNNELLSSLKKDLEHQYSVEIEVLACDFTNSSQIQNLAINLTNSIKQIDLLINNVGIFEMGGIEDSSIDQLQKLLKVNLEAAFTITKSVISALKTQKSGHIFNIGSIVTQLPKKEAANYTISKMAFHGFTEVLRDELKDYEVKVTELIPGSINTSSWDGIDDVPKEKFIQTKDIIDAIWTCYQANPLVNWEQIVIRPLNRNF